MDKPFSVPRATHARCTCTLVGLRLQSLFQGVQLVRIIREMMAQSAEKLRDFERRWTHLERTPADLAGENVIGFAETGSFGDNPCRYNHQEDGHIYVVTPETFHLEQTTSRTYL